MPVRNRCQQPAYQRAGITCLYQHPCSKDIRLPAYRTGRQPESYDFISIHFSIHIQIPDKPGQARRICILSLSSSTLNPSEWHSAARLNYRAGAGIGLFLPLIFLLFPFYFSLLPFNFTAWPTCTTKQPAPTI